MKIILNIRKFKICFPLAILFAFSVIANLTGHSAHSRQVNPEVSQVPPPDRGSDTPPGGLTIPGTTRPGDESKCPQVPIPAIPFFPEEGQTTRAYPTFWFYIPYVASDVDRFTFSIRDDRRKSFFPEQNIQVFGTPGLIRLTLPSTSRPLEDGKRYRWEFKIFCDPDNVEDRTTLEGTLQLRSGEDTSLEALQRLGLWSDTLSLLEELQQADSDNPQLIEQRNKFFEALDRASDLSDLDEEYLFEWNSLAEPFSPSCCSLTDRQE